MFGLPRHIDDVAAQSARAVSIWAARALATLRPHAQRLRVAGARAGDKANRVLAFAARRLIRWAGLTIVWIDARIAAAATSARADIKWLRTILAPVALAAVLAGSGATMIASPLLIAVAGVLVLSRAPTGPAPAPAPAVEVLPDYVAFIDRFAALNDERWVFSDGWHNGYWVENDWRRSTLHPSQNGLAVVMGPNPPGAEKPFASGELQSQEHYRYGYFEVRMRVPRGSGTGVGFFTYTEPEGRSSWQEIDIEFIGRETRHVEFTVHIGGRSYGDAVGLPFDAADGLHTYAFEWTPEGVRWYVDNELAYELTNDAARRVTSPQRLYLSLWTSKITAWTGELDRSGAPWTLEVACVAQAREYRGVSLCAPRADPV